MLSDTPLSSLKKNASSSTTAEANKENGALTALTQQLVLDGRDWQTSTWSSSTEQLTQALEQGDVLYFPKLAFKLSAAERALLQPEFADPKRKNISLNPKRDRLNGFIGSIEQLQTAKAQLIRYQDHAQTLVHHLFPHYRGRLQAAPASLRLHRVETRHTSWRQDDTRLHIDAFPSRPNHGQRILRVFCNIAAHQEARIWRVGERFELIAQQFLNRTKKLTPAAAWLMHRLGITKQRRSAYDQLMLQLHDAMKRDLDYQRDGAQSSFAFPPGSTWICYSDQVPHAVMSGQFMMEQTYFLAPQNMAHPEYAPLAVLERLTQKKLV